MLPLISQSDRDRIFQDWGQMATLDEVEQRYDPATGMLSEASYSTPITLIVAGDQMREQASAAAVPSIEERRFLVQESQLPTSVTLTSAKITFDGKTYAIRQLHPASLSGVLLLECAAGEKTEC